MKTVKTLTALLLVLALCSGCFIFAARAISKGIGKGTGGNEDSGSLIGDGISDMVPFMD